MMTFRDSCFCRDVMLAVAVAIAASADAQCPGIRPAFTWASVDTAVVFSDVTDYHGFFPDSVNWYLGDGTWVTDDQTTTHTYAATGAATVSMSTWVLGCMFTTSALVAHGAGNDHCTVPIYPSFYTSQPANNQIQFTNATIASDITLTQAWLFGDLSAPDLSDSPQHFYLLPGTYAAALSVAGTDSVTMDGCVAGMARTIAVDGNASTCDSSLFADFTMADLGGQVQVEAQIVSSIASLLPSDLSWDFGDQSVPLTTLPLVTHSYPLSGEYQICLHLTAIDSVADDSCTVVVCRSLEQSVVGSAEELDNAPLSVFPNPFTERLTIRDRRIAGPCELLVFDLSGAVVASQSMQGAQGELNLGHLARGAYVLQANAFDRSLRCPVIKY